MHLPDDVVRIIIGNLEVEDMVRMSSVCSQCCEQLQIVSGQEGFWRDLMKVNLEKYEYTCKWGYQIPEVLERILKEFPEGFFKKFSVSSAKIRIMQVELTKDIEFLRERANQNQQYELVRGDFLISILKNNIVALSYAFENVKDVGLDGAEKGLCVIISIFSKALQNCREFANDFARTNLPLDNDIKLALQRIQRAHLNVLSLFPKIPGRPTSSNELEEIRNRTP